ncbi:MAG TPA: neutral/alkaline non-lysosomal ceramidase N-terminal domain-containing protein [Bryobacteraceae bacterium]|nr:neutral/alkaline non-lysosomal ceramidase N-terminal domain-containing protein [Bryobacteraceae bacterium]
MRRETPGAYFRGCARRARRAGLAALWLALLLSQPLSAALRAGVAQVQINPDLPAWLTGFAARTSPATRIMDDLHAKAIALDDGSGERLVLVTADLIGFTREIIGEVAARAAREHRLERRQIVFNASHTHSGPSVWPRLHVAPVSGPEVDRQLRAYAGSLISKLDDVITRALEGMQPATLDFALGEADFATNRRLEQLAQIRPGQSFPGPVDRSVPALRVRARSGATLAIVFGYACHNTVLTADFNEVSADYAGYAQRSLERAYPGSIALFTILCAGDQRPAPRGKPELAARHGETLSLAVRKALSGKTLSLTGPLRSSYEEITLPFQVHSRDVFEAESKSTDFFLARRGRLMIEAIDAGKPALSTPYPVQAFRIGNGPAWIALGGEVVVDYQLRLEREFGARRVVVLGSSNDVMGYIPSRRVQREGGYEAGDSLVYFSQPGWFTEEVEDLVLGCARRLLSAVGLPATPRSQSSAPLE